MVQIFSWEANWFAASQIIPQISRNQKVHYRTPKCSPTVSILSQPNPVNIPTSHVLKIHPNIIHPFTNKSLRWPPSLQFPHQDPIKPRFLTHTRHIPSPSHPSRYYHPENIGWGAQIIYLHLMQSPPFPINSSLLGTNIHLNTIFSNNLRFLSIRNVNDQYKTTGNIIFLYILIFKFLDSYLEDKRFCTEW